MKRIFIINAEGKWFAMRLGADGVSIDQWCDDERDAALFKPRDALDLVYRYNRAHVGVRASFELARFRSTVDIQDTVRQEVGA